MKVKDKSHFKLTKQGTSNQETLVVLLQTMNNTALGKIDEIAIG